MSAFLVPVRQIRILAKFIEVYPNSYLEQVEILAKENLKSISYKYEDYWEGQNKAIEEENYIEECKYPEPNIDDVKKINIKQISSWANCLEYQSCEHPDYFKSEAYYILSRIYKEICSRLEEEKSKDKENCSWAMEKDQFPKIK